VRRNVTSRQSRIGVLAILVVGLLTAVGSTAGAQRSQQAAAGKPATAAQWAKIVAQAKSEGSVTLYTPQNPALLADMAAKFKSKYGISVTINRQIDGVLATQVNAEEGSKKAIADIWVSAAKPLVLGSLKNGWVTDAVGPTLFSKAYSRPIFAKPGKAFVVGEAILGLAWNTQRFPAGLKDLPDLLNPALDGKLGVVIPSVASLVDWWDWVEATYGKAFVAKLAALHPKKYSSSLPMGAAVIAGEIAAGSFVPPTVLDDKAKGAPVGFTIPRGSKDWNAPYYAMILKQAPHPAAAQLLGDYMVSQEGQSTSQRLAGTVRKDVKNAFYVEPRQQKLLDLTPTKVQQYQAYWNGLFK
jgi:iron(III) transport system substrate-binding protein